MTEHKNRSERLNSATLLSGDKICFVPQPVGHDSFENTINGITAAFRTEGNA